MKKDEIEEAEKAGVKLVEAILDLKKLNKKQLEYLELKFNIAFDRDKLEKLINCK